MAILLLVLLCPRASYSEKGPSKVFLRQGEKTPWHITARSLTFDEKKAVYIAQGDVLITKGDESIYTKRAVYNTKTGIAVTSGGIRFVAGQDILTGTQGEFDLKRKTGKIKNGRLFLSQNHYYITGKEMEKLSKDTYLIKDCRLTTCDGVNPAWAITGSEVTVTVEGYGKVKHAAFRAHGLPILYVPYIIFPAKTKRQSGLLPPRIGLSTRNGMDIEVPLFWAISDQTDATLYQRLITKRGYMQGLEFRYISDKDSKGAFLFDILSDKKKIKNMNDPDDVELSPYDRTNTTRYWFRSKIDQKFPHGLDARLDADVVSDQDYLREFEGGLFGREARADLAKGYGRPMEETNSPTRRSALRLAHDGDIYSLQALACYDERPEHPTEDQTPQPLGGIELMLLPDQLIDLPIFASLDSDYDYVWRDVGQKGHRLALSPEVKVPLWLFGDYIEFEPSVRYAFVSQWLDEPGSDNDYQYKRAYEARARMSSTAERIYDLKWGKTKRLKHRVSPVLAYTYRALYNEKDYTPWFEPIDHDSEEDGKTNLVSLSLENFLDARQEDENDRVTYRQWAAASICQGYDIDEARRERDPGGKRRPFEPLTAELSITPFPDLDLRGTGKWDHYEHEISSATISCDFSIDRSGGRRDSYRVDYRYATDGQKNLDLRTDVNLLFGLSVGGSLERDLELDYNISNSYWLEYQTQCWGVKLAAEKRDEKTSIMLVFQLLGLGDNEVW